MLVILTVVMLIGVMIITVLTVSAWLAVQVLMVLSSYETPKMLSVFTLLLEPGTNPDLAFASMNSNSCLLDRHVLEKFPRSQHQPLLITPPRFALSMPNMCVK